MATKNLILSLRLQNQSIIALCPVLHRHGHLQPRIPNLPKLSLQKKTKIKKNNNTDSNVPVRTKNGKPSGPAERPSKATRDPIQTYNKFESLEDNVSSAADAMDTTPAPAPAPGRSHSLSPRKGRNRSWHKDKSSIRLPP